MFLLQLTYSLSLTAYVIALIYLYVSSRAQKGMPGLLQFLILLGVPGTLFFTSFTLLHFQTNNPFSSYAPNRVYFILSLAASLGHFTMIGVLYVALPRLLRVLPSNYEREYANHSGA